MHQRKHSNNLTAENVPITKRINQNDEMLCLECTTLWVCDVKDQWRNENETRSNGDAVPERIAKNTRDKKD